MTISPMKRDSANIIIAGEFKKATDLTPVEFINRTRCEFAKNLLESKKYSVAEIGEMSGFSTSAHFSKTFKGFFGVYPSDYMKKMM